MPFRISYFSKGQDHYEPLLAKPVDELWVGTGY